MTKRSRHNMLLVAVIAAAGPLALTPGTASAGLSEGGGGTCCEAKSGTCYLNVGDGIIITESPAFYQKAGEECPPKPAEPIEV